MFYSSKRFIRDLFTIGIFIRSISFYNWNSNFCPTSNGYVSLSKVFISMKILFVSELLGATSGRRFALESPSSSIDRSSSRPWFRNTLYIPRTRHRRIRFRTTINAIGDEPRVFPRPLLYHRRANRGSNLTATIAIIYHRARNARRHAKSTWHHGIPI